MGVAGAGKSMQGRILADEKGYAWISTGEILRVLVTGKRRQEMPEGKFLSDAEMIRMIDKVLDLINLNEEFIFDGFPRTVKQAEWLMDQVHMGRFSISAVFHLSSSEEVVLQRLKQRGRVDDTESAIRNRFDEYKAVTLPIIKDFRTNGIPVYDIDGAGTPEQVHDQIVAHVQ
mgnify:FL=1